MIQFNIYSTQFDLLFFFVEGLCNVSGRKGIKTAEDHFDLKFVLNHNIYIINRVRKMVNFELGNDIEKDFNLNCCECGIKEEKV